METVTRLDITNPEHIIYVHGELSITVFGGIRLEGLDRMRTTLKIQAELLSIKFVGRLTNNNYWGFLYGWAEYQKRGLRK